MKSFKDFISEGVVPYWFEKRSQFIRKGWIPLPLKYVKPLRGWFNHSTDTAKIEHIFDNAGKLDKPVSGSITCGVTCWTTGNTNIVMNATASYGHKEDMMTKPDRGYRWINYYFLPRKIAGQWSNELLKFWRYNLDVFKKDRERQVDVASDKRKYDLRDQIDALELTYKKKLEDDPPDPYQIQTAFEVFMRFLWDRLNDAKELGYEEKGVEPKNVIIQKYFDMAKAFLAQHQDILFEETRQAFQRAVLNTDPYQEYSEFSLHDWKIEADPGTNLPMHIISSKPSWFLEHIKDPRVNACRLTLFDWGNYQGNKEQYENELKEKTIAYEKAGFKVYLENPEDQKRESWTPLKIRIPEDIKKDKHILYLSYSGPNIKELMNNIYNAIYIPLNKKIFQEISPKDVGIEKGTSDFLPH